MALDIHRFDNNDYLLSIDDEQFNYLDEIFKMFTQWTGLVINQHEDFKLTTENQETIIKIIDKYLDNTNLNINKQKTSAILEFKGILRLFSNNKVDLQFLGD